MTSAPHSAGPERLRSSPGATTHRVAAAGLIEHAGRIDAFGSTAHELAVNADEEVTLLLAGDGDTDLDLFVYDEAGELAEFDHGEGDLSVVRLAPPAAAVYRVEVHNLGAVFNAYRLAILRKPPSP